jgi:hypothetical protein
MTTTKKFCLDDYLPKALNYDISLLDTSDECGKTPTAYESEDNSEETCDTLETISKNCNHYLI